MSISTENSEFMRRRRSYLGLLAPLVLVACSSGGPTRSSPTQTADPLGFSITERVQVGSEVQEDFAAAVRLMQAERYAEGIAMLEHVTARAPEITAGHIDLGIAYRQVDEMEKAEASLQRALELNPQHPVAYNELGLLYRKSGRFEEAKSSYEKALALQPAFHYARRNLAILCDVYLADLNCALDHYEIYVESVPDDEDAAMWVADIRNRVDQ